MIDTLGKHAKTAAFELAKLSTLEKNALLQALAQAMIAETDFIILENAKDLAQAQDNGVNDIMVDRLRLTAERILDMAEGIRQVATLADPVGQVMTGFTNLDGLKVLQTRVPIGVIGMILKAGQMSR